MNGGMDGMAQWWLAVALTCECPHFKAFDGLEVSSAGLVASGTDVLVESGGYHRLIRPQHGFQNVVQDGAPVVLVWARLSVSMRLSAINHARGCNCNQPVKQTMLHGCSDLSAAAVQSTMNPLALLGHLCDIGISHFIIIPQSAIADVTELSALGSAYQFQSVLQVIPWIVIAFPTQRDSTLATIVCSFRHSVRDPVSTVSHTLRSITILSVKLIQRGIIWLIWFPSHPGCFSFVWPITPAALPAPYIPSWRIKRPSMDHCPHHSSQRPSKRHFINESAVDYIYAYIMPSQSFFQLQNSIKFNLVPDIQKNWTPSK